MLEGFPWGTVQKRVVAPGGWGRRPQVRRLLSGGSLAVASPTPATHPLLPAKVMTLNHTFDTFASIGVTPSVPITVASFSPFRWCPAVLEGVSIGAETEDTSAPKPNGFGAETPIPFQSRKHRPFHGRRRRPPIDRPGQTTPRQHHRQNQQSLRSFGFVRAVSPCGWLRSSVASPAKSAEFAQLWLRLRRFRTRCPLVRGLDARVCSLSGAILTRCTRARPRTIGPR